jgi:enoyl-CoA hydratase/carnithine racemase
MMNFRQRVNVNITDGIASVQLDRPDKRNALDLDLFRAIVDAQKAVARRRDVQVVILSGAGQDFSTGLDVKAMFSKRSGPIQLLGKWWPWGSNLAQRVSVGWRKLPVPVIAAIQGNCWGGGLQIALGADFRLVHPLASLSILEGKWGLIPDMGGTLALRELLPRDQAMRLAMTAEVLTAEKALELGLVTAICEDVFAASQELAAELLQRSPDALKAVKRLYRKSWQGSEGAALARESLYQLKILAGQNQRIAVRRQRGEDIPYR